MKNDLKKQVEEATNKAEKAEKVLTDIKKLKEIVLELQKKTNKDTIAAEKAAIEAKANQLLALAMKKDNELLDSIELLNKAIELKPDFYEAYFNRGLLKSIARKDLDALADYDKAIELSPDSAKTYCYRGILKRRMGNLMGAMEDFDRAVYVNPDFAPAFRSRGDTRAKWLNDMQGAEDDYNKFVSLRNHPTAYEYRATFYRKWAEVVKDEVRKAELIAKAEADEKKAEAKRNE